jgi:integrase
VQKQLGPAWTERGGRWPATSRSAPRKRSSERLLEDGRDPAAVRRDGSAFAEAAAEWLRFIAQDRDRKPSTPVDSRCALNVHLLPVFGERSIESITTEEIELWRHPLSGLSNRSKNKLLIQLHGIFRRAQTFWGLRVNPLARVEKHPMRQSGDIQVFSPEEVWALVRVADSEQDRAIYLTAAFTGLRMGELLAS